MAGASMKDIKRRIRSVESTMQITKAMQLVASSKLRRARDAMESSRPFFDIARSALENVAKYSQSDSENKYLKSGKGETTLYIVLAGDRGLAGGYNSNAFKRLAEDAEDSDYAVLPIGKKAVERFRTLENVVSPDEFQRIEGFSVSQAFRISDIAKSGFTEGKWKSVKIIYTNFASMLSQTPEIATLLPIGLPEGKRPLEQMVLEPSADELFEQTVRVYLAGMIYSAACNSFASELGARRTAMDSATRNAGDMIESLKLNYNRARQGAITQELTEIVAGAEH